MKILNAFITIFIILLLSACSSTQHSAMVKKPMNSDHNLMLSLLKRPQTQDQKMMLAFAQAVNPAPAQHPYNTIEIKGPKADNYPSNLSSQTQHNYRNLIARDLNAVWIMGPK